MTKYQALFDHLRQAILRGEYAPDALLPSEHTLAIHYQVSRITTKRALNELAAADLIYRIQGKGSFVKPHAATATRDMLLVLPFANVKMGDYASGITQILSGTTWHLETITTRQFQTIAIATLKRRYAGIFYYPQDLTAEMTTLIALAQHQIPTVVLDSVPATLALPSVTSDNTAGGALAVTHLQAQGYQHIAFCSRVNFWQDWVGPVADRFLGYLNAYTNSTKHPDQPLQWAEALSSFKQLPDLSAYLRENHIQALIMGNDVDAVKLSKGLQSLGWHLPNELAVVGFDNLEVAITASPALTTLTQDFTEIGRQAVDLLLAQINNPSVRRADRNTVPVRLVARASTPKLSAITQKSQDSNHS